jgi:hypothetical protein
VTVERPIRAQPRRGRQRAIRWALGVLLVAIVFAVGVALGQALHDNPKPGITVTTVSTVQP